MKLCMSRALVCLVELKAMARRRGPFLAVLAYRAYGDHLGAVKTLSFHSNRKTMGSVQWTR
jgi:hypothetical protein